MMRCPASVERWLSEPIHGCPCGRKHPIGLRKVVLAPGALDLAEDLLPEGERASTLLLLADTDTYEAAGARVAGVLRGAGRAIREAILERKPLADGTTLERLREELGCRPCRVVAVGSGTISDLGKIVAAEAGVPLMTVGTAASMNGYSSSIAALTISGLKATRPASPPDILLLDTLVLAAAPPRLTRAGFGDLCSKPVSSADWVLSHRLLGDPLCPTALSLAGEAASRARAKAEEIGRGDPPAVETLAEALVLSGLSMTIAGASSPASGGEHLLSHYLDMSAEGWGREPALHGEQVAVGTLACLALYERLRRASPPEADAPAPSEESAEELAALHSHLGQRALGGVLAEARAKSSRRPGRAERRRLLACGWADLWASLDSQLAASEGIGEDLFRARVPRTFGEIGVEGPYAVQLLRLARHIRNRYTALDLAADLGGLDRWAGEIAAELAG